LAAQYITILRFKDNSLNVLFGWVILLEDEDHQPHTTYNPNPVGNPT